MTRLIPDLEREAARCQTLAHGYRMSGERNLATLAQRAGAAATLLIARLEELSASEAVARDEVTS